MKKTFLLKMMLLLCTLVAGSGTMWATDPIILFHETFGDNSGSARSWDNSYSVKSGVSAVYSGITGYTVSNVKQSKNTTGSTKSGLNQSSTGTDAEIIIGPLNVTDYESLGVTYQWKAGSIKGTYTTKLEYATSSGGSYKEVSGTGTGATTFVERSYSLPAAAQVSTLYLKITWNTSNTPAIIDEVELTGIAKGGGSSAVATTTTIDASAITNTNKFVDTAAGSLSASVTYGSPATAISAASVTWSGDNDEVATINASTGAVTLVGAGTVTFTASYAGVTDTYQSSSDTYEMTVTNVDPNAPGSETNPYTVAQARAAIDAGTGVTGVYATGIVSKIVTEYNSTYHNISYNISTDGLTTSDQLQAYRGKSFSGDDFTSADGIQVGDVVVIYGNLTKYSTTYEFNTNNQLVSLNRNINITDAGFATFASDHAMDFSGVAGLKAYKATVSGENITFTKVTTVPAGEGVLLQGDAGTYNVPATTGLAAWDADDNAFVRGTGAAVETGTGPYNYILNKVGGVVGFYKAANQTVATNRAYLQSETAAARISLNFDDEETNGISATLMNSEERIVKSIYNLAGQRVAQPTKGLYIKNGRKVIVK